MMLGACVSAAIAATEGNPTVAASSVANAAGGSSWPVTVSMPSGITSGDLLIAYLGVDTSGYSFNFSASVGWTELVSANDDIYNRVYYRVANGSSADTLVLSRGDSANYYVATVVLRIADSLGQISGEITDYDTASASPNAPSLTVSPGGVTCLWLKGVAFPPSGSVSSGPDGYTEVAHAHDGNNGANNWVYQKSGTSGTEAASAFALDSARLSMTTTICVR